MTKTYALKRLLEHGSLTFSELMDATGWEKSQVKKAIYALVEQGIAYHTSELGQRQRKYSLVA